MRRLTKKIHKLTGNWLDLPDDVVFDLPRITMIGNMQAYIENHRGVLQFTTDRLKLRLNKGQLEITGQHLVIRAILPEEVFVEGHIQDIKYIEHD